MRISSLFALGALLLSFAPMHTVHAAGSVGAGDLIRGETFSAVYYMGEDGFRYVFPNEKTYKTWYADEDGNADFSSVTTISDAELAKIQIGGNVTYRPQSRMVKINTDPKVYTVAEGGVLRWISTEMIAEEVYGSSWNMKIDDVPDGFFANYSIGEPIEEAEDIGEKICFDNTEPCEYTISDDKGLTAYLSIWIDTEGYALGGTSYDGDTTFTIDAGETVRFWNVDDDMNHTATADDSSWGTGTLEFDEKFVKRFNEPGTYEFYCSYHPEMTGTIIVE